MATIFSHALVGITLGKLAWPERDNQRICMWAAIILLLPDLDVLGFPLGIPYHHFLGHRGFTHSLLFALISSVLLVGIGFRAARCFSAEWWKLSGFFFAVAATHGLFDAMTDGGLGVAFFSPFDNGRYFLPWTPLHVSPIGRGFLSEEGLEVVLNEALWLWLPCAVLLVARRLLDLRAQRLNPPSSST